MVLCPPFLLSQWAVWMAHSLSTLFLTLPVFVRLWFRYSYLAASCPKGRRHLQNEGKSTTLSFLISYFHKTHRGVIAHQQKLNQNILKILLVSLPLFSSLLINGWENVNFTFWRNDRVSISLQPVFIIRSTSIFRLRLHVYYSASWGW